jgi:hypothetical protein
MTGSSSFSKDGEGSHGLEEGNFALYEIFLTETILL